MNNISSGTLHGMVIKLEDAKVHYIHVQEAGSPIGDEIIIIFTAGQYAPEKICGAYIYALQKKGELPSNINAFKINKFIWKDCVSNEMRFQPSEVSADAIRRSAEQ